MKLYYTPGACSMAVHIAMQEAGLSFEIEKVDIFGKQTETGKDFTQISAKGYVPVLELDNGDILTEAAVVLQYIADENPDYNLAPTYGSMERYRLMEWLSFISTEIHKTLGALFNPDVTPEWKDSQLATFGRRCDVLDKHLDGQQYLLGDQFSIADAHLFAILGWTRFHKVDLSKWPALVDFVGRVAKRPAVIEVLQKEGLKKR